MWSLPKAAEPLISAFSMAFSPRTFQRVVVLILGAILSLRRRTVTAILATVGPLAHGHWSDFHRVLCRAAWSVWPLGQPVVILVDDTTPQHKGRRFTVTWYGGKTRRVELVSGAGQWYKGGAGLVPVRWVHVHDVQGTHRDEYLYPTDPTLRPD